VGIDTSKTMKIKLKNIGTSALAGSVDKSSLSAPFGLAGGGGAFKLGRNQTKVVTLKFTPVALVESSGSLTITSNDPANRDVQVSVAGAGLSGTLSVSTESLDFPAVKVTRSKTMKFTIKNGGPGVLHGSIMVNQTGATAFSVTGAAGFSLAYNKGREVTVKFAPATSGAFAATIAITSDGGGVSIPATGTGE